MKGIKQVVYDPEAVMTEVSVTCRSFLFSVTESVRLCESEGGDRSIVLIHWTDRGWTHKPSAPFNIQYFNTIFQQTNKQTHKR